MSKINKYIETSGLLNDIDFAIPFQYDGSNTV